MDKSYFFNSKKIVATFILFSAWGFSSIFIPMANGSAKEQIQRALDLDDQIYCNKSLYFTPQGIVVGHTFESTEEQRGVVYITLLSKIFLGSACSPDDEGKEYAEQIKKNYQVYLGNYTNHNLSNKIKDHKKFIQFMNNTLEDPEEIKGWIKSFKEKRAWSSIIDEKAREESKENIERLKIQSNHFILKHSLSCSNPCSKNRYLINGALTVYPGHDLSILEEDFSETSLSPQWEVARLRYQIFIDRFKSRLHIHHIATESLWQKSGIGYALAQYITDYSHEHFPQVSVLTVSCRHSISENLFEKCGFKRTDEYAEGPYYNATHHLENHLECLAKDHKFFKYWHAAGSPSYKEWHNENYTKIYDRQFHKKGFKFF